MKRPEHTPVLTCPRCRPLPEPGRNGSPASEQPWRPGQARPFGLCLGRAPASSRPVWQCGRPRSLFSLTCMKGVTRACFPLVRWSREPPPCVVGHVMRLLGFRSGAMLGRAYISGPRDVLAQTACPWGHHCWGAAPGRVGLVILFFFLKSNCRVFKKYPLSTFRLKKTVRSSQCIILIQPNQGPHLSC